MRLTKCMSTTIFAALVGIAALTGGEAHAADSSLSVPMFGDRSETLWPVELTFEIVAVESGEIAVPARKIVAATDSIMSRRNSNAAPISPDVNKLLTIDGEPPTSMVTSS